MVFLPKQLHQDLQTPLASHLCGQIQDLIGWFARSKQEMKDEVGVFSLSFLAKEVSQEEERNEEICPIFSNIKIKKSWSKVKVQWLCDKWSSMVLILSFCLSKIKPSK